MTNMMNKIETNAVYENGIFELTNFNKRVRHLRLWALLRIEDLAVVDSWTISIINKQ